LSRPLSARGFAYEREVEQARRGSMGGGAANRWNAR
jgi:hypothetical protein